MPTDFRKIIDSELSTLGVGLAPEQRGKLADYCRELERWNRKINLTGLEGVELVRRLVAQPVWIAHKLQLSGVLVDIGSGNGSPAIPMRVVSSLSATHLVEARAKRAAFLRHVVITLGLGAVETHLGRFETIAPEIVEPSWVTLQAVSLTSQLIDSIRKIATKTTRVVWIGGDRSPALPLILDLQVPNSDRHVLVLTLDHS